MPVQLSHQGLLGGGPPNGNSGRAEFCGQWLPAWLEEEAQRIHGWRQGDATDEQAPACISISGRMSLLEFYESCIFDLALFDDAATDYSDNREYSVIGV